MEENGFQVQAEREQKNSQAIQITLTLQLLKNLTEKVDAVKKEIRTVREELRNINKLRPLRSNDGVDVDPVDINQTA